jgi:hypothetical protein
MKVPNCDKCQGYLYREDDPMFPIQVVVCLMCGQRTYRAGRSQKEIRKERNKCSESHKLLQKKNNRI